MSEAYHERCRQERAARQGADQVALHVAHCAIHEVMRTTKPQYHAAARRYIWRLLRRVGRATYLPATDRLEWRGRCHQLNGLTERVTWPGGKATRHTVHLRERARCLLMGRDYPIAGPSGWLP